MLWHVALVLPLRYVCRNRATGGAELGSLLTRVSKSAFSAAGAPLLPCSDIVPPEKITPSMLTSAVVSSAWIE